MNGFIAVVLGVAIVAALPWWRPADPLTGRAGLLSYAPSGLAAKVAELAGPGARVVVPQTWGSWFEWAAPEQAYFIDSRFELFPADVWADYAALAGPRRRRGAGPLGGGHGGRSSGGGDSIRAHGTRLGGRGRNDPRPSPVTDQRGAAGTFGEAARGTRCC